MTRYVALLRAIANVSMAPFRRKMEELGFADVLSVGMSGNLIFSSAADEVAALERRIAEAFGTDAMVRSAAQMARIAARNPYADLPGSSVMFLAVVPSEARRKALRELDFVPPVPVLRRAEVYFTYPLLVTGKRTHLDIERLLGVRGTGRSSGIVRQVAAKMTEPAAK